LLSNNLWVVKSPLSACLEVTAVLGYLDTKKHLTYPCPYFLLASIIITRLTMC